MSQWYPRYDSSITKEKTERLDFRNEKKPPNNKTIREQERTCTNCHLVGTQDWKETLKLINKRQPNFYKGKEC